MAKAKTPKDSAAKTAKPKAIANKTISQAEPPEVRELAPDLQERIRARAYELWEQRGRQNGNPEEDWARAEHEIVGELRAKSA